MARPDLRELECFVAVAEHLNFTRAAEQLHLSQPPLTRHVQALEEKLGSRLFERNTHSVALTDLGRLFLEDARSVLGQLDRAGETIRRAREGETVRLRLAFVGALLDERFVRLIRQFRGKQPRCQVHITDLAPASQLEALLLGQIDGGFIGAQPIRPVKNIGYAVCGREPLLLALPEKHPLIEVRVLHWHNLKNLPWVMVSRSAAPAFRQQFSGWTEQHGLAPRIVQESERVPAILTMVAAGSGVTIVPQGVARLVSKGIHFRKLPSPRPFLQHTFAYRTPATSPLLEAFLALLNKVERRTSIR
jgi:DNA-binding transcriptional LysR family regulator